MPVPKPTNVLSGYRFEADVDDRCENPDCHNIAKRYGLYAKNTKTGVQWLCKQCAVKARII